MSGILKLIMASIYDVAKAAGVSPSTVSFVLNGKGEKMRIAKKTIDNIRKTASALGYIPNVAARKLTSKTALISSPEIAILWSPYQHFSFLNNFIDKAQTLISSGKIPEMRFSIIPFEEGALSKYSSVFFNTGYNGILVPPISADDLAFLNDLNISTPLILLYGDSDKHSVIKVDNAKAGNLAAEVFSKKGMSSAVLITEKRSNIHTNIARRKDSFSETCEQKGISVIELEIPENLNLKLKNVLNPDVGKWCSEKILELGNRSKGIFVQNDLIAYNLISALKDTGIDIPSDMEVIAYGSAMIAEISSPTITTIHHDYELINSEALKMMAELLVDSMAKPKTKIIDTHVFFRDSCPEM